MCEFLPACVCEPHVCLVLMEALDFLELELEMAVSHQVHTGTEPGSFGRSVNTLNYWAITPAPYILVNFYRINFQFVDYFMHICNEFLYAYYKFLSLPPACFNFSKVNVMTFFLLLKHISFNLYCLFTNGCRVLCHGKGNLPRTALLKVTYYHSLSSHQLSKAPHLGWQSVRSSTLHVGMLDDLILGKYFALYLRGNTF